MTIRSCTDLSLDDPVPTYWNGGAQTQHDNNLVNFLVRYRSKNVHLLEILHEQTDEVALTQQQILSHRLQMFEQFVRTHNDVQHLLRCIQVHAVDHDMQFGVGNVGKYVID